MPLLISESDVRTVLTMGECMKALESAYKQEGLQQVSRPSRGAVPAVDPTGKGKGENSDRP